VTEKFGFIGVTTSGSSIMSLFPVWADLLGLDAAIVGIDIPMGAPPAAFRSAVTGIKSDGAVRGGLVTTHKLGVYRHAGDLFDELDEYARLCEEVSCVSKRGHRLIGFAKDPITAARALREIQGHGAGTALIFGCGGAGTAIGVHLMTTAESITFADIDPARIAAARRAHSRVEGRARVTYVHIDNVADAGEVLASCPPGALVVNATGLGKDLPGSPIGDEAVFPDDAVVWDLNYRGDLKFLVQARRQAARGLRIHDGWSYFLHGWAEHIAEVYDLEISAHRYGELVEAAAPFRPATF
jgi:shikimate dehydrogenase